MTSYRARAGQARTTIQKSGQVELRTPGADFLSMINNRQYQGPGGSVGEFRALAKSRSVIDTKKVESGLGILLAKSLR